MGTNSPGITSMVTINSCLFLKVQYWFLRNLEKYLIIKWCLLHTEIFSKRRKIYSLVSKRLDLMLYWIWENVSTYQRLSKRTLKSRDYICKFKTFEDGFIWKVIHGLELIEIVSKLNNSLFSNRFLNVMLLSNT